MAFDPNKPIFKTDWGNLQGQQILTADSELRRGVNNELGAKFIAQINTTINKWAKLSILTNARVAAIIQTQIQTPLDLFDEAGLAVRLQAILEAAVAVGLNMSLTMGQLHTQIKTKPYGRGLSGELIELLLNETELEGGVFGQYAIGFMAYANFVLVGSLHKTNHFEEPGFQFVYDAGMGFIVGGGYRSYIKIDIPNSRFLVDRFSNVLIDGVVRKALGSQRDQAILLGAMLKIGIRASYEVSDQLSKETSINSDEIARKVLTIFLEQLQKVMFLQLGLFFRDQTAGILNRSGLSADQTAQALQKLNEVNAFEFPSHDHEMFNTLHSLAASIQDEQVKREYVEALSALWVSAYFTSLPSNISEGVPFPDYTGSLPTQFQPEIKNFINTSLNRGADANLNKEDILKFLLNTRFAAALQEVDNVRDLSKILSPAFGSDPQQVLQKLFSTQAELTSAGTYKVILTSISKSFDDYVDREISGRVTAVSNNLSDEPEIAILYEQALLPSIQIVSDIVLPEVANGFQNFDSKTMLEVLSSSLLTMIGRSVVHIIGTVSTSVNDKIEGLLLQAVSNVTNVLKPLGVQEIVKKPLEAAIKIIADILAPLPQNVQDELFTRAVNLVSPIEGNAVDYANRLKNDITMMPQGDEIEKIGQILLEHLSGNMISFAVKLIPALFQALIDELLQLIEQVLVVLAEALDVFKERIEKVVRENILDELVGYFMDLAEKSADALTFNIFNLVGAGAVKDAFFNALGNAVRGAVERVVLPIILLPFKSLKFDPRKVVDVFRDVSDFSFENFSKLFTNHIFSEVQRQIGNSLRMKNIGFDLEVPVSFTIDLGIFGKRTVSHTFTIVDLIMPSPLALEIVMRIIRNNLDLGQSPRLISQIMKPVLEILDLHKKISQLQQDKLLALQNYAQN